MLCFGEALLGCKEERGDLSSCRGTKKQGIQESNVSYLPDKQPQPHPNPLLDWNSMWEGEVTEGASYPGHHQQWELLS